MATAPIQLYDPRVALQFFKAGGKPAAVAQGSKFFGEGEKAQPLLLRRAMMYLLLDGEVDLVARGKVIGAVRKGEIFGELAPIGNLPRSAAAVAKTPCRVIALDDKRFRAALERKPGFALMLMGVMIRRLRETIARLRAADALRADAAPKESAVFDKDRLRDLARGLSDEDEIHYNSGKPIVSEGQAGIRMYVVLEGRVAVMIGGEMVERLGPGGVFGELALVGESPRLASVVAETDCDVLPIRRLAFEMLVKTSPDFAAALLRSLAGRLRSLSARASSPDRAGTPAAARG